MLRLDGNPFEMATFIIAILACGIRPILCACRKKPIKIEFHQLIADFLNGICILPFLLLLGAVFSTQLLTEAMNSARVFFAVGGWIGLAFVLRELCRTK